MRVRQLLSTLLGTAVALAGMSLSTALAAPAQLRGKAVVISWTEQRRERSPATQQETNANRPFALTVYVSPSDQTFNRLSAGNAGSSDQAKGSKDRTRFAVRAVNFSGTRMTVTNTFSAGGARQISATFDAGFSGCTGTVVIGRSGSGPITQSKMGGGEIVVLSVSVGAVSCAITSGNPFQ